MKTILTVRKMLGFLCLVLLLANFVWANLGKSADFSIQMPVYLPYIVLLFMFFSIAGKCCMIGGWVSPALSVIINGLFVVFVGLSLNLPEVENSPASLAHWLVVLYLLIEFVDFTFALCALWMKKKRFLPSLFFIDLST